MNIEIENYMQDGANYKARAIMCLIQGRINEVKECMKGINKDVDVHIGRFENCREQGYVLSLFYRSQFIRNYAFYEHRNSDQMCLLMSDTFTINTPRADAMFGDRGKYDVDKFFESDDIVKAADYIIEQMITNLRNHVDSLPKEEETE